MSQQVSRYQRSFPGMVGAMLAALLVIVVIWGLSRFQHRDVPNPAQTVDYSGELHAARKESPFPILAPNPVPPGWRATSVTWDDTGRQVAWHLGFLTSSFEDADYVGLEQGNAPAAVFTRAVTPANQPGTPVTIDGQRWNTLTSTDGSETAIVHGSADETTVVTGTVPLTVLIGFAKSLSATH